jgi:hypothetical protein
MQYVVQEITADVFREVPFGASIVVGDVVHPWQITELWPVAAQEAVGVFHVAPAMPPHASATVKGYHFARVEGVVVQLLDIELPPDNTLDMSATARQIRLAMNALGLREDIEAYVASQSQDVRDSWQYTSEFKINHPFIIAAAEHLNKSDAERVALFSLAQTFT